MDNRKEANLPFADDMFQKELLPLLRNKTIGLFSLTNQHAINLTARIFLLRLLQHVVYGEQAQAESILKIYPTLLLEKETVTDYSGRHIHGTALQIALGAEDVRYHADDECMVEMIQRYFDKLPDGKQVMAAQIAEQFPEGWEILNREKMKNDSVALDKVIQTIAASSDIADCELAIQEFRDYLAPKSIIKTGKHFNALLLVEALRLYEANHAQLGRRSSYKNDLCWRNVIGTIQRYLPASSAQAFCQGIHTIVEDGAKLKRSLTFPSGHGTKFFPLDLDANSRLGFDVAVGGHGGVKACWNVTGTIYYGQWGGCSLEEAYRTYNQRKMQTCSIYISKSECILTPSL